jgi:ribosomal-protein-alanine N-acetyltransferase
VTVVPMTAAHVEALMAFEHEMFGAEAWAESSYRWEIAETRTRSYYAAEGPDGELLGWAGVMVVEGAAEILTVGVVPSARRQGIAIRLVHALLDEARRREALEVFLEVRVDNVAARSLYEREGFAAVGHRKGYYEGGRVDAVVMRRAI